MKKLLLLLVFLITTVAGFAQADVVVTNTNNQTLYVSGASVVYYIRVKNNGPSQATGVQVSNPIPAGFTASWTGSNGTFGSNGLLNTIPVLAYNEEIVYTLTLNVPAGFTGALTSVASVATASVDPDMANNQATDTDQRATTGADIVVTNTDNESYYYLGASTMYVIKVKNNGPQVATNVHLVNAKPSGTDVASWYSSHGYSGSGNISNEIASLPVGQTITYYFTVNLPNLYTGTLTSIANVTSTTNDPIPENNTNITDYDIKAVDGDVKVSVTNNQTIYTPGGTASYTVVVKNDGPLAATDVNVANTFPAGITNINWTGTNTSSGTGALSNVIASLPSGASVTYTVDIQIPTAFTGSLAAQFSATPTSADPTLTNNTATDTDAQISGANIVVTNTNAQTTYAVGSTTTYTITVTNQGPEVATNVNVFNAMPNGVATATWSGNNTSSGTGDLQNVIPTLAVGASVVYTFNVDIPNNYLGSLKSETIISGPTFDPFPTCANCIDVDTPSVTTNANVAVTLTDGQSSYVANQTLTYTATVRNLGPNTATNVHVVVPVPTGITNFSWTGTNGSSGTNIGLNNTIPSLVNAEVVTYTIVVQVPTGFTGNLVTQISATSATNDPILTNNTVVDTDTPALTGADIKVVNTNNTGFFVPGANSTYTVTVTNQGPQTAYLVAPNVTFSPGVTLVGSWTGSNGSTGTTLPLTNTIAQMNVGDVVTYTITVNIPATQTANVVSTANATLQTPSDPNFPNTSVDTDVLGQSDVEVVISANKDAYTIGNDVEYTVTVSNNGPREATNIVVENLIPAGITGFSWTGSNSSTGTDIPLNNTIPTLASGASVVYTITVDVPVGFSGNLVMNASATSPVGDPIAANNQDTVTTPLGELDLQVTNTNLQNVYTPGGTSTYNVTVTNNGPGAATNIQVTNLFIPGSTAFSWSGNGNSGTDVDLIDTIPLLASGSSVTYTIIVTVSPGYTGNINSTATAMTTGDLDLSNNVATDTDAYVAGGDVSILILDNQTTYTPGTTATYNVTVSNIGTTNAANVLVNSIVSAGVNSYSWTGNNTSGTGAINNTIASLASGETVTYTITFFVPGTFTTNVVTQVSITNADSNLANNTSTDTNTPSSGADLVVVNTDLSAIYIAGQTRNYTIQITNYGPQDAQNVEVQNPVPAGIDASTVSWIGNGTSGTGNLQNTIPTLAVGQTVTYTFTVPVPSNFPQNVNLVSEVTVTSDTVDPNPGCTQCLDIDTPTAFADLAVTKTDNRDKFLLSDNTVAPPQVEYVTYLITVVNNGPSDATNVVVIDNLPPGINNAASMVWDASNGTSGSGAINQTIPSLLAGQTVNYVVSLRIPTALNSVTGNLVNTVNVSSSTTDNLLSNNIATDIDFPSDEFVTVNTSKYNVEQLVRDVLINEPCVNISNFTASADIGFGYFHRNNSDFPFKEGIHLRAGDASKTGKKYDADADGSNSTTGSASDTPDLDLAAVMNAAGLPGNQNKDATFVKFNFVPTANEFSFNFIFATQEYGTYQCSTFFVDAFAFVLTNLDTGEVKNLAVVPNTTIPISSSKIKDMQFDSGCASQNVAYFGQYNSANCNGPGCGPANQAASDINLRGQTVSMKASSLVEANVPYSIKLVVADVGDMGWDSGVFIEAGSFNIGGPKITGTDIYADDEDFSGPNAICEGTTRIIRAATEANPDVTYEWRKNDVIMPGENTYFIEVSEPGVYTVTFTYGSTNCSQSDFVIVEFQSPIEVDPAQDLYVCNDATPEFDLTVNKATVLADYIEGDFDAEYYHTKEDADLRINRIGSETPPVSLTQYPGVDNETVYIRVINQFSGGTCDPIEPFKLFLTTAPTGGFSYTDDGGAPGFCIGSSTSMLPVAPGLTPGGTYSATPPGLTIVDPATGEINVNTSLEGVYTVIYEFTGLGCDPYTSPPTEVIISPCIATIASHSGNVCEGTPTFDLMATDAGVGATYEWKDNDLVVFSNLQNPTAVPVPTASGSYNYTVVATVGTSTSAPSFVTLIVHPIPTASFVTNSTTICTGTATTVQITGTPGATVNLTEGSISRVVILNTTGFGQFTTDILTTATTITLVDVVTNTVPPCNFTPSPSPSIVISVGLPTATMVGFTDPVICLGTTGSFTIQGTPGALVSYTIDGGTPIDVTLPTGGQLLVTTDVQNAAGTFTYALTAIATTGPNGCSNIITGETATLTVNALPTASFSTTTPTVCQNTPATINFTGPANGTVTYTDHTGATAFAPLDGSGNFSLTTANLPDPNLSYTFTLVSVEETLLGVSCSAPLTGSLTIEVDADPVFVSITPATGTVLCIGDTVTLEVDATGDGLSYQWYKDSPANPVGSNLATFTIPSATSADAGDYYVVITGSCGTPATSTIVELILNQPTVIVDESPGATYCQGDTISLFVDATGVGLTFQWYKGTDQLPSETNPTLTIAPATLADAGTYRCVISNPCPQQETTQNMVVVVNELPGITAHPQAPAPICVGEPIDLFVTAAGTGLTYEWRLNGNPIPGAPSSSSYNDPSVTLAEAGDYTVVVSGACAPPVTSNMATVVVNEGATITQQTQVAPSDTVCSGTTISLSVATIGGTNVSYQWLRGTTPVGTDSELLTINSAQVSDTGVYTCVISSDSCPSFASDPLAITINQAPVITDEPEDANICEGETHYLKVEATGSNIAYQWYKGTVALTNGNTNVYEITSATVADSGDYHCVLSSAPCADVTSVTVTLTVKPLPVATVANGTESEICSGESSEIVFTGTPGAVVTYNIVGVVQNETALLNPVTGEAIVATGTLTETTVYELVSVSYTGTEGCLRPLTGSVTVTVHELPQVSIEDGYICVDPVTLAVTRNYTMDTGLNQGDYTFEWSDASGVIPGAVFSFYEASAVGQYAVKITDIVTGCEQTAFATVDQSSPPISFDYTVNGFFSQNPTVTITAQPAGDYEYQLDYGPFQDSNVFDNIGQGIHTITVRDPQACDVLTQEVTIIDYPKYFTPNGDGIHDTWNISEFSEQLNAKIYIFDRFGKLVKEISTKGLGWDGTYNGQPLPATDYWFTLDYEEEGIRKEFKAHFSLKR